MICRLNYIFMWIFLIPQPTGYVFIILFLYFQCLLSSLVSQLDRFIIYCTLFRLIFLLKAADCGAL